MDRREWRDRGGVVAAAVAPERSLEAGAPAREQNRGMAFDHDEEVTAIVGRIARAIDRAADGGSTRRVACAESLTSGQIATALGAGEASGDWFMGGVVAYHRETKFRMLGVEPGPVVRASAARQMARGVADATGADVAVAVTGVGGPEEQDGQPVGTVFLALHTAGGDTVERRDFGGAPVEVVRQATLWALERLAETLESDA
jgi:nicotinamide-nucleotide amidase